MFRKLAFVAAALGAAALTLSALAPAATAQEPAEGVRLHGRGVLEAHGSGLAAVRGNMDYNVHADQAVLLIRDEGGDARVHVEGYAGKIQWNGFDVYFGFHGSAQVVGPSVAVIALGEGIDLHAAGEGWAFLKGRGVYSVNGRPPQPWTEEGSFAAIP